MNTERDKYAAEIEELSNEFFDALLTAASGKTTRVIVRSLAVAASEVLNQLPIMRPEDRRALFEAFSASILDYYDGVIVPRERRSYKKKGEVH